jgi:NAD-dependent SIR2 family protein deacetylase
MLERRLDDQTRGDSKVRQTVSEILRAKSSKPAAIHKALMSLAERGGARTIVTTKFDLLLQASVKRPASVETYSLASIPRPTRQNEFAGVLHIHGC